jgi:hypothetical protein
MLDFSKMLRTELGLIICISSISGWCVASEISGSNPDFAMMPDPGTTHATVVMVINEPVTEIGDLKLGSSDGTIPQTQTLEFQSEAKVVLNDSGENATGPINQASASIEKTGILTLSGGIIDAYKIAIFGVRSGDKAQGGLLNGFGVLRSRAGILISYGVIKPIGGVLRLNPGNLLKLQNTQVLAPVNTQIPAYIVLPAGNLSISDSILKIGVSNNGGTMSVGKVFPILRMPASSQRTGFFKTESGIILNEGYEFLANGIKFKITYSGGASKKDILVSVVY